MQPRALTLPIGGLGTCRTRPLPRVGKCHVGDGVDHPPLVIGHRVRSGQPLRHTAPAYVLGGVPLRFMLLDLHNRVPRL
jgi:hypothetical protein